MFTISLCPQFNKSKKPSQDTSLAVASSQVFLEQPVMTVHFFCVSKKSTEVSITFEISIKLADSHQAGRLLPFPRSLQVCGVYTSWSTSIFSSPLNLEYTVTSSSCYFHFFQWRFRCKPLTPLCNSSPYRHHSQKDSHWRTYLSSRVQQRRWHHSTSH